MNMTTETRDPMLWRELPEATDSRTGEKWTPAVPREYEKWTPAVPREYVWTGTRRGVACRIQCRLIKKLADGVYMATAVFAHNVAFLCNDRVKVEDLVEVTK
jgi:hypothetical protein